MTTALTEEQPPAEPEGDKLYNTAYVVSKHGIVCSYRKIHLFSFGDEQTKYAAGSELCTATIDGLGSVAARFV